MAVVYTYITKDLYFTKKTTQNIFDINSECAYKQAFSSYFGFLALAVFTKRTCSQPLCRFTSAFDSKCFKTAKRELASCISRLVRIPKMSIAFRSRQSSHSFLRLHCRLCLIRKRSRCVAKSKWDNSGVVQRSFRFNTMGRYICCVSDRNKNNLNVLLWMHVLVSVPSFSNIRIQD